MISKGQLAVVMHLYRILIRANNIDRLKCECTPKVNFGENRQSDRLHMIEQITTDKHLRNNQSPNSLSRSSNPILNTASRRSLHHVHTHQIERTNHAEMVSLSNCQSYAGQNETIARSTLIVVFYADATSKMRCVCDPR